MRDVMVFRKPMGGESYLSPGIHALRPVVLVRSNAMGGKAAIGGGLVMGLLVGAAIVAGVVVLAPPPEASSPTPNAESSATPAPSESSSSGPSPSTSALPGGSGVATPSALFVTEASGMRSRVGFREGVLPADPTRD